MNFPPSLLGDKGATQDHTGRIPRTKINKYSTPMERIKTKKEEKSFSLRLF
jgi:hypothetical protein